VPPFYPNPIDEFLHLTSSSVAIDSILARASPRNRLFSGHHPHLVLNEAAQRIQSVSGVIA